MDETTRGRGDDGQPRTGLARRSPMSTTGETFTIADFKGKVVLVETMAQWCPTCKRQQMEVKALHEQLGMPADLVTIALDIDPNENGDALKTYAAGNGFDWIYAISPADVSREIGNLYGGSVSQSALRSNADHRPPGRGPPAAVWDQERR